MLANRRHKIDLADLTRAALVGVLSFGVIGGCARPRKTAPAVDPAGLDDMGFQAYLADIPLVTVDEACRAMLILADGEDKTKTWSKRREVLLSRGLIRSAWGLQPNNLVDRGTVAFMICRICEIRGGVNCLVLGSVGLGDRRYAHRELVHRGLMPRSTEWQSITGGQMVSLLGKADELMEEKELYGTETFDLGAEPVH